MAVVPLHPDETLEGAIAQLIALGEKDPLTIARKLADRRGGDWVAEQLASRWEEILAEIARQRLGSDRRSAVVSLAATVREHDRKPTKRDVLLTSLFVPKKGYVRFGDATADDLDAAQVYRVRLANGLMLWADWLGSVRALMDAQGVAVVKALKGALPEFPSADVAEIGGAA